jgi:CheY-like chemotaxis protein
MRYTSSTILLVESNPRDVLRLLYAFARAGHHAPIESSNSLRDAVAQLQGTGTNRTLFPTPGLLVINLNLDQGTGFEVLEWVQSSKDLAGLPSVVLTPSRQPRDVQRAYALGAHDYRVTPASIGGLCAVVRDIEAYWAEAASSSSRLSGGRSGIGDSARTPPSADAPRRDSPGRTDR